MVARGVWLDSAGTVGLSRADALVLFDLAYAYGGDLRRLPPANPDAEPSTPLCQPHTAIPDDAPAKLLDLVLLLFVHAHAEPSGGDDHRLVGSPDGRLRTRAAADELYAPPRAPPAPSPLRALNGRRSRYPALLADTRMPSCSPPPAPGSPRPFHTRRAPLHSTHRPNFSRPANRPGRLSTAQGARGQRCGGSPAARRARYSPRTPPNNTPPNLKGAAREHRAASGVLERALAGADLSAGRMCVTPCPLRAHLLLLAGSYVTLQCEGRCLP